VAAAHRTGAAALVVATVVAAAAAGCGAASSPSVPVPSARPLPPPATVRTSTTARPAGPVEVREVRADLVDRRRTVTRRDGSTTVRRLPTTVRLPEREGRSIGARPLVVFLHGYDLEPTGYRRLLTSWARAGYVVAAPALPGERATAPGGPNRADLANQPADARFVVDRLIARSAAASGALAGRIDATRIAIAGHSDGGNTAVAVAADPRSRSRRIDAAILLAAADDLPGLSPMRIGTGPPTMVVQGTADTVNPVAASRDLYARLRAPKLYVSLTGAGHFDPYMRSGAALAAVSAGTRAFLDRALLGTGTWAGVAARARRPGVATVTSRTS
jgi:predicted dienelactone hydrolase